MIYAIGDSHAEITFGGVPGVRTHRVDITLKRAGYPEDDALLGAVGAMPLGPADVVIFCFGEPDCRSFVHPQAMRPVKNDVDALLETWVERYLVRLALLPLNGARVAILSVAPPTTTERSQNPYIAPAGTDAERADYARRMHAVLSAACRARGLIYVDTYSRYADDRGMLRLECADASVHVKDPAGVRRLLVDVGLLSEVSA